MLGSVATPKLESVDGPETLLRGMSKRDRYPDGKIKKSAFKPSRNGKDKDGLSVSINRSQHLELHRRKFDLPEKLTASITVFSVRAIVGLGVKANPLEEDPAHALITGIPDAPKDDSELKEAERMIAELAKAAKLFAFPPADPIRGLDKGANAEATAWDAERNAGEGSGSNPANQ